MSGVFSGQNTTSATSVYLIFNKLYIPTTKCDAPPRKSHEENETQNKEVVGLICMNDNQINIEQNKNWIAWWSQLDPSVEITLHIRSASN